MKTVTYRNSKRAFEWAEITEQLWQKLNEK